MRSSCHLIQTIVPKQPTRGISQITGVNVHLHQWVIIIPQKKTWKKKNTTSKKKYNKTTQHRATPKKRKVFCSKTSWLLKKVFRQTWLSIQLLTTPTLQGSCQAALHWGPVGTAGHRFGILGEQCGGRLARLENYMLIWVSRAETGLKEKNLEASNMLTTWISCLTSESVLNPYFSRYL